MVITSQPSTSTSLDSTTVIPVPKPRRLLNLVTSGARTPVPSPRKSLQKSKSEEKECNEEVRLRRNAALIRRDTYQPIFIEREKLQRILEVAEPQLKVSQNRPLSFPSCSPSIHQSIMDPNLDLSSYDNAENCLENCSPDNHHIMSARAIARNRGASNTNYSSSGNDSNERPLSAYEESAEATRQRKNRRASVAVMPMMELDYRDRVVAGSARSSTMTRRKSDGNAGREFSPDFGAIRVQVEDITSVPGSMMAEDDDEKQNKSNTGRSFDNGGETSTETITDAVLNGSLMSNGVRRVSDWAVPIEYASSPIAQELSQSEVEERPRPPIPAMYMNTSTSSTTTTTDRGEESVYSDFVLKRNSSSSSMSGKSVTLLEQIIRTHAVWYLPHMGRPEVLHLLRRMEPGNFIVRASTRENCMALSVRLAPGAHVEIDHYIIEKLVVPLKPASTTASMKEVIAPITAKAVRLEGSPLTFKSLPLLIEHYCVNEDELEHRLQLPSAIRACTTTKQLLSIAVMEQEFWSREMSLSRKKTASTSSSRNSIASSFRSNTNNNNTMPRCNPIESSDTSTWFMDRPHVDDESIYDEVEPRVGSKTGVGGYYTVHDTKSNGINNNSPRRSSAMLLTPEMALGADQQKTSKKRRSSSRTSSSSNSRFATVCVGDFTSLDNWNGAVLSKHDPDETDSGLSTHSPPSKHDRLDDVPISRSDRRSQSVRSHKSVTASPKLGIPSSTSSTLSRPRSFLRSLLSFGSSKEHKRKESLDIDSTPRLANCEYFTPWDSNGSNMQGRTSRSAFDITNPPARGFFGSATPKKRNGVMPSSSSVHQKNASSSNMFDDDNYTRGWKEAAYAEMTASPHHNNNHLTDPSMRTFKPPNYDDVAGLSTGSPSSRSRPLAMRRERSDLGVMSNGFNLGIKNNAQRLAHHNESSPGPTNSNGRVPMTPPANAGDPQVQQNCVEELRRKRLQSANEMLSPHEINAAKHPYGEVHSAHASPQIAMRRRNGFPSPSTSHNGFGRNAFAAIDRNRGGDHRLSVPNLIAATDPMVPGSVGQSAKALRERLGGRTTDGELMVINEGLVTPVVRRKTFAPAMKTATTSMDELGGEVMKKREALEAALNEKRRHPSDSLSSGSSDHSSLGRRKTSTSSSQATQHGTTESELVWRRAKHNAPTSIASSKTSSGGAPPHQWSAVNHELKNRQQKIAKVLPTPQPRGHHNRTMSIVGGPSIAECRRSSDYAQLCDFATSTDKSGLHLDVHSKIEDDAVSVAGTVFNEPWDSNVWENLLDLAHHGDESTTGLKVSEPIQEEDSDSDRTAGGDSTCQMDSDEDDDDDEDDEIRWQTQKMMRRPLPSDRVTVKGWEQESDTGSSKFNTLESRSKNGSIAGSTLRRQPEGSFSIRSLPRALSRFSQTLGMNGMSAAASFGSIDDLPTTLPSMSPLLSGRVSRAQLPRSASTDEKIGRAVQDYVEELAQVKEGGNACFGLTLRQFIACTKDTKESDPAVVIRNVRQFINGMKNYLVKHGEGDLHRIIDEESSRLNSNQILNIDAVLEAVLHKLLLREVKPLLYHVMIKEHSKAGALQLISQNQGVVRKMNITELGFTNPETLVTPSASIMEQVKLLMRKMQNHYSPMKKLENLMKAVGLVLGCQLNNGNENENPTDPMNCGHRGLPPGDDLVRWFVYILARTSTVGCEVEAWYMWELLPQPIVTQSDASYYLTSLWSAVHVLKSTEAIRRLCENDQRVIVSHDSSRHCCSSPLLSTATLTRGTSAGLVQMISAATCDAFVKIAVPDEAIGCVRYATFPGVPMLTTSKLSRLVAHQQGITNPEEHGLYLIAEGFESCLSPSDCPVLVHEQLKKDNKPHMFAYKRHEAKIAWPRAAIC